MYGSWVLLVLIFISSFPVVAVYIWFRLAKYQFSLVRFLFALLAGAAAFFPALILQELLIFSSVIQGRAALFYEIFIRVALSEELSRLFMLFIFFLISSMVSKGAVQPDGSVRQPLIDDNIRKAMATGLIAGLGFAILESARFAASNPAISVVLLRIFTAALHAACGSRIGTAAVMFRTSPLKALLKILSATAIHGVYNFLVTIPGIPSIMAILIAVSALTTTILALRGGWDEESVFKGQKGS